MGSNDLTPICLFFKQSNNVNYKNKHEDLLFSVQKNTDNTDSKMIKTKNDRFMLLSKCSICGNKKVDLLKNKKQKDY